MRFVIIGGDAAGMSAASRARRNDPELEVTVLEQGTDVSYSACNIPYNIADPARELDDLVVRSAAAFRDRLLIATGATSIRPAIEGMDLPGVFTVKNLEDGRRIKEFLRKRKAERAVILGMGYIALEMTEALADLGLAVDLVKPHVGLLPWLHRELAKPVRELLEQRGVGLYDGHRVDRITADGDRLRLAAWDALEESPDPFGTSEAVTASNPPMFQPVCQKRSAIPRPSASLAFSSSSFGARFSSETQSGV